MKKKLLIMAVVLVSFMGFCAVKGWAGEMDILVNKLVEKGILTPYEGQILKAEAKEEAAKELAEGKAITAPSWTQRIKVKGDVRFRTQVDWQDNHDNSNGSRVRNRIRGRLGVEGKVNDQIAAGIRLVTGSDDARSTNQTLSDDGDGTFGHPEAHLDKYYIKWTPELPNNLGNATFWGGKFSNPMQKTELLWDSDITLDGVGAQFMSSPFNLGDVSTNLYSNGGYFWLLGDQWTKGDPMLISLQGGLKMDLIKDWDAGLNMGVAYYDFTNVQREGRDFTDALSRQGAGTNTFLPGTTEFEYDYNLVDFLIKYDSKQFFDFKMGHGLYSDLIWNTSPNNDNFGVIVGGYIGDKKPKKPGQWKVWGNWRYLERDAVPDYLPDSDFVGWVKETGASSGGGTNAQGFNGGIQYAILKNTVLCLEYYWMEPIHLDSGVPGDVEPYQLLQLDIKTKF